MCRWREGAGIINRVAKSRVLLGVLFVLISALSFGAGCSQASDQSQALEEQQQENEELRKEIEAQDREQREAEEKEEEAE